MHTAPAVLSQSPADIEDVAPVRSRLAWSAVVGGSVVAVSLYFLLTLFGAALGFSISDKTTTQGLTIAAAVYAIAVTAVCLFVGGLTASQLAVGENKREGALYGLLVWAVVFAMLMWLMASGVKSGFNAMVGVATAGVAVGSSQTPTEWEATARQAGFSQAQIDDVKGRAQNAANQAKATAEDPAARERAAQVAGQAATTVSWLTFGGTLAAMLAAMIGGRVGAGPTFRLFAVPVSVPNRSRLLTP